MSLVLIMVAANYFAGERVVSLVLIMVAANHFAGERL